MANPTARPYGRSAREKVAGDFAPLRFVSHRAEMLVQALLAVCAYDNGAPHSRLPPLGWSSWVALGREGKHPVLDYCDDASVHIAIEAFHDVGLYGAGYRHFHLDDCWAGFERDAEGRLHPDPARFPGGMRPIIDHAHERGLTFGLYTCAGNETCFGGRVGSRGHWTEDAASFAEWGVDAVKMDWCHTDGMDPKTAYAEMSAALNQASLEPSLQRVGVIADELQDEADRAEQTRRSREPDYIACAPRLPSILDDLPVVHAK